MFHRIFGWVAIFLALSKFKVQSEKVTQERCLTELDGIHEGEAIRHQPMF